MNLRRDQVPGWRKLWTCCPGLKEPDGSDNRDARQGSRNPRTPAVASNYSGCRARAEIGDSSTASLCGLKTDGGFFGGFFLLVSQSFGHVFVRAATLPHKPSLFIWHRLHPLPTSPWFAGHDRGQLQVSGGLINSLNQFRMQQLRGSRGGPSLTLKGLHSIYHTAPVSIRKGYKKIYLMDSFQCGGAVEDSAGYQLFMALSTLHLLILSNGGLSWLPIICHGTAGLFFFFLAQSQWGTEGKRGKHCRFWAAQTSRKSSPPQRQELWYNTDLKWSDTVLALQRHRLLFADNGRAMSVKMNNSSSI